MVAWRRIRIALRFQFRIGDFFGQGSVQIEGYTVCGTIGSYSRSDYRTADYKIRVFPEFESLSAKWNQVELRSGFA